MSTFLYALKPNGQLEDVIAGSGQTNSGGIINLQIDMTTSGPYLEGNSQRAITKAEVIEGIEVIKQYIIRGNWTPP